MKINYKKLLYIIYIFEWKGEQTREIESFVQKRKDEILKKCKFIYMYVDIFGYFMYTDAKINFSGKETYLRYGRRRQ